MKSNTPIHKATSGICDVWFQFKNPWDRVRCIVPLRVMGVLCTAEGCRWGSSGLTDFPQRKYALNRYRIPFQNGFDFCLKLKLHGNCRDELEWLTLHHIRPLVNNRSQAVDGCMYLTITSLEIKEHKVSRMQYDSLVLYSCGSTCIFPLQYLNISTREVYFCLQSCIAFVRCSEFLPGADT